MSSKSWVLNPLQLRLPFSHGTLVLLVAIALANLHLVTGLRGEALVFLPSAVAAGEWWRLLTFPFVHVSWYHLLLDASAFLMLYQDIVRYHWGKQLLILASCCTFSLGAAVLVAPSLEQSGLCGLSGIAHGLLVISALDMVRADGTRRAGTFMLLVVVAKSVYEATSGTVVFEFLHFGMCGAPVAISHAGGVIGGFVAAVLCLRDRPHLA